MVKTGVEVVIFRASALLSLVSSLVPLCCKVGIEADF